MSDVRKGRSRKVSLADGDDPRDRSSVGDSLTADMLGPGLELVNGKIQLKISPGSPHYFDEMGYLNTRAEKGLTITKGSPMSLQAVPADASVEVTPKGIKARPSASQVRNDSSVAGATVSDALSRTKASIDTIVATPPAVFVGAGLGNGQVRDPGGAAVGALLGDNGLFTQIPGASRQPTASVSIPANVGVVVPESFTLTAGISCTIAAGAVLSIQ